MRKSSYSTAEMDSYVELVRGFPLRPLRSNQDLDRAVKTMDSLLDREDLSDAERDYLDVLSEMVERFEDKHHPIPPLCDAEMLRFLIESKGASQAEIARKTGIAESTVSDVLSGKRTLNRSHIGKLASYFGVGPGVFVQPSDH